jgi:methylmalonyl-CoA mutase
VLDRRRWLGEGRAIRGALGRRPRDGRLGKAEGEFPIVGVKTFLNKKGSPTILPQEVIRSTTEEKEIQLKNLKAFHQRYKEKTAEMLKRLQKVAISNGNLFEELMETVQYCSLGQITHALYEVGGQYKRNR